MGTEKNTLTEEQRQKLEEEIRTSLKEMIQSGELDEGLISTLIARTTGAKAGLSQLGANVATVYRAIAKGQTGVLKNPKVVKNVTTAITRIKTYEKKFQKIMFDLVADLEFMFGNDFESAPEIEDFLGELDELSTKFAGDLGRLSDQVKSIMTGQSNQTQLGQDLEAGIKSPAGMPQPSQRNADTGNQTVSQRVSNQPQSTGDNTARFKRSAQRLSRFAK